MVSRLLARSIGLLLMVLPAASFAAVTPYPPFPGAVASVAYKVAVAGQPTTMLVTGRQFSGSSRNSAMAPIECSVVPM